MCRSIKKLRRPEQEPTDEELEAAALQFVRKVSGYRVPSRANEEAFNRAVKQVAAATRVLFDDLVTNRDTINAYAQTIGLEGVALISIDDDWSAMRFKVV